MAKGASAATIKGTLKGDQTIDYSMQAKAGQTMSVSFKTSNASAYFNVLPPGSTGAAIFIGSTSGNEWTGTLPADGEYRIRTYLMRSAARRNESTRFTLTVGIGANFLRLGGTFRTQFVGNSLTLGTHAVINRTTYIGGEINPFQTYINHFDSIFGCRNIGVATHRLHDFVALA